MSEKPVAIHLVLADGSAISISWGEVPEAIRRALVAQAEGRTCPAAESISGSPDHVMVPSPYSEVISVGR